MPSSGPLYFHSNLLSGNDMPEVRVELTRGCPHRILSPARLPFRHSGKWLFYKGLGRGHTHT